MKTVGLAAILISIASCGPKQSEPFTMPVDRVNLSFPAGWQTISQEVSNAVHRGFIPKLEQMGISWGMVAGFTYGEVQPGDKELTAILYLSENDNPIDPARKAEVISKLATEGSGFWPNSTCEAFTLKNGETGALLRIPTMSSGTTDGGSAMLWWMKEDRLRMLVLLTSKEQYPERIKDFEHVINSMSPM